MHLGFLHGILEVVINPGDEMGVEACQGEQGWGRRRCTEGVHVPGELWPDPKCLIEKAMSFCKDSGHRAGLARMAFPNTVTLALWVPCQF